MSIFNPLDKFYKSVIGAVSAEDKVTFRVKGNFGSVLLLVQKDGETSETVYQMDKYDDYFQVDVIFTRGLYFYCFKVDENNYVGLGDDYEGVVTNAPIKFQLTVFDGSYSVPSWLKGGIIYQIFPDRFCSFDKNKKLDGDRIIHENWLDTPHFLPDENGKIKNNDFFGGDIKGIISKLDYLYSLGVTAIYLNPIFKANSNHRYDTGDYMKIDPLLGTEADLIDLINKAEVFGIKIILDGVFNHTGDDSLYFNKYNRYPEIGAYQSKQSKYFNWYKFTEYPDEYKSWWGIKILPATDKTNEDFLQFIAGENGVIEHYTKLGIGGWRLDVVDELPSAFVKRIRSAVKSVNKEAIVIGEVWEDASNKVSYDVRREYFQGYELDSVMNYPLKDAIINFAKNGNAKKFSLLIKEQIDHYPKAVLDSLMNILSTHDTVRLLTALGGQDYKGKTKTQMSKMSIPEKDMESAKFNLKVATLLQYTLYGVPSVFYGDEIGMQGYVDPLNRKCYPWGKEDVDLFEWYKKLGAIRKNYKVFVDDNYQEVFANGGAFVYKRESSDCEILVAINVQDKDYLLEYDGELKDLLSGKSYKDYVELKGKSYFLLVNNNLKG